MFAPRPEWSSFCEEERRTKKRERRTDVGAQINYFLTLFGFFASSLALASSIAFWAWL